MKTKRCQLLTLNAAATMNKINARFGNVQRYAVNYLKCRFAPTTLRGYLNGDATTGRMGQLVLKQLKKDGLLVEKEQELDQAA